MSWLFFRKMHQYPIRFRGYPIRIPEYADSARVSWATWMQIAGSRRGDTERVAEGGRSLSARRKGMEKQGGPPCLHARCQVDWECDSPRNRLRTVCSAPPPPLPAFTKTPINPDDTNSLAHCVRNASHMNMVVGAERREKQAYQQKTQRGHKTNSYSHKNAGGKGWGLLAAQPLCVFVSVCVSRAPRTPAPAQTPGRPSSCPSTQRCGAPPR